MRKSLTGLLALAVAVGVGALAPVSSSAAGLPEPGHLTARQVATLPAGESGSFAESMAASADGTLLVSLTEWGVPQPDGTSTPNVGQVYAVAPSGATAPFGPRSALGPSAQAMGIVDDGGGRVFVAVANVADDPASAASGVYRVTHKAWTRIMTLPGARVLFPNGLTIHDGMFYVTDSASGTIWRGPVGRASAPDQPWFASDLLAPPAGGFLGANGIAYRHGAFYVTNAERGLLVRVPVGGFGPPAARVVVADPRLVSADGIAFDPAGRLWVAVNGRIDAQGVLHGSALVIVGPRGEVRTAATPPGSLVYPTQPVLGRDGTVYVANGDYLSWADMTAPTVEAFTS